MENEMINDEEKIDSIEGSEVLPYKSSFAKSFVTSYRDSKPMDTDNNNEEQFNTTHDNLTNIFSPKMKLEMDEMKNGELEQLRKQCQDLNEENQRLQCLLQTNQTPRVQAIDNVLLQTQIDTLRWQMKQNEASQQMYRSLMRQMLNFLERARKSLDIIHERTSPTGKNKSSSRHNRSMSVYGDTSTIISSSSSIPNSKFTRAKSINQISSSSSSSNGYLGFRDFTWSVLRRNDSSHGTSPRNKQKQQDTTTTTSKSTKKNELNNSHDGIVYRRANNNEPSEEEENEEDHVPPDKLSQDAFRLMRTIESLLATRELDLATVSSSPFSSTLSSASSTSSACSTSSSSMLDKDPNNNKKNTSTLSRYQDKDSRRINSLSTINDGSFIDDEFSFKQLDETFIESDENKKFNDDNCVKLGGSGLKSSCSGRVSSPGMRLQVNKTATIKDDELRALRDDKPVLSSADDESGFSSMSSFQDVGIPVSTLLPIGGGLLHTEVGLPEVPLDKNTHRRWASSPIDLQSKHENYLLDYYHHLSFPVPGNPVCALLTPSFLRHFSRILPRKFKITQFRIF